MRLKKSFELLYKNGTNYLAPEMFANNLTSCQLKVKPKKNNIAGLQLADMIVHPSRCEILYDQGLFKELFKREIGPFEKQLIGIIKGKYYQKGGKVTGYGKKFLPHN